MCLLAAFFVTACATSQNTSSNSVTPAQARAIAWEAYIYANPVVDNYRVR